MKGTGRIILSIFGFVALVIIYVHLQVVTFLASYEIYSASEKIHTASEQLRRLKFDVERFKAPHLLEGQVRSYEMNLALPEMVYRVPQSFDSSAVSPDLLPAGTEPSGAPQLLKQVLNSWIQVAHAKSDTSES